MEVLGEEERKITLEAKGSSGWDWGSGEVLQASEDNLKILGFRGQEIYLSNSFLVS